MYVRPDYRMPPVLPDSYRASAENYALGALDGEALVSFEAHLLSGCLECRTAVKDALASLGRLARALSESRPLPPELRQQLLDLATAPALPIDLNAIQWEELAPGIRLCEMRRDDARGMRACLVWASPGAKNGLHRHGGDECILVLAGALRDERGSYSPGQVCRSTTGSVHSEEIVGTEDCICYVVYYGPLEPMDSAALQ